MTGTTYSLELRPNIPPALARLPELAENLVYSWNRDVRGIFWRLDPQQWRLCGNNPKLLLRRVAQARLDAAAADPEFLAHYAAAVAAYDAYQALRPHPEVEAHFGVDGSLVAYFSAEFGLHESFPIYSGGLGILAGDHCKAASDLGLPFVAVGLLYRQGYFAQTIDVQGRQQAHYNAVDFADMPVEPVRDVRGEEVHVEVEVENRRVAVRLWMARIGHVRLYLLDTDLPANGERDRAITHQLYGGGADTRIQQEIVLGIGGVRALRALGLEPTVWHINEGHAALLILERMREKIAAGVGFAAALEATAAGTVFTTHTPVAAGHDVFTHAHVRHHLGAYLDKLGVEDGRILALGADAGGADRFNMTALALRGSRFHNGVSRIHGEVASRMERYVWPQIPPEENPIGYVNNGVHVSTFLSRSWLEQFCEKGADWADRLLRAEYWKVVDTVPDAQFADIRRRLKCALLAEIAERLQRQHRRNRVSEAVIARIVRNLRDGGTERTLLIGFARRFAAYKRATLVLGDPARLARILGHPERPAILVFAGKAHPNDGPGQELIRQIYEISMRPEFIGRLILLEGYDIQLARDLVQGCDVWLNTPEYPLEASGTSGMKAAINGGVNVSVLDGWWAQGYSGDNGFAVTPATGALNAQQRDAEESHQLLDILENQVVPLYYGDDGRGHSPEWLRIARNSMKSIIPRFNTVRMVIDYVDKLYAPAQRLGRRLAEGDTAAELAAWKERVRRAWPAARLEVSAAPPTTLQQGARLSLRVWAALDGLTPADVTVECVIGRLDENACLSVEKTIPLEPLASAGQRVEFGADIEPLSGFQHYRIRMFPTHPLLAHRFEMGCMVWA
ncbi:MAG: alpha-glucan family phosphorylase [Nevskia sp.]|nr:alpha-glucan family phosphorylase [Nevskia sp.]